MSVLDTYEVITELKGHQFQALAKTSFARGWQHAHHRPLSCETYEGSRPEAVPHNLTIVEISYRVANSSLPLYRSHIARDIITCSLRGFPERGSPSHFFGICPAGPEAITGIPTPFFPAPYDVVSCHEATRFLTQNSYRRSDVLASCYYLQPPNFTSVDKLKAMLENTQPIAN